MDQEQTRHQPGHGMVPVQPQVLNVFPERLIEQILGVIRQRADLIAAFHQMSDEQAAWNRAFNAIGAGMAVRQYLPSPLVTVPRNPDRTVLLFDVPASATSARVWSTGGVADLQAPVRDAQGHMPIPANLRPHQIARVEFYDATRTLVAISGREAPPPEPEPATGQYVERL